jgi:hypothetical protein
MSSVSTGGVATDITGAATLTSNLRWEFVEAPASGGQGPLYGVNGIDTPKQWTGTGNIADWTATPGPSRTASTCCTSATAFSSPASRQPEPGVRVQDRRPEELVDRVGGAANGWAVDLDPNDGDADHRPRDHRPDRPRVQALQDVRDPGHRDRREPQAVNDDRLCRASLDHGNPERHVLPHRRQGRVRHERQLDQQAQRQDRPDVRVDRGRAAPERGGTFFNDHYYLSVCTSGSTTT